ncbi:hypothetical protein DL98DRAFT_587234 [Cadophora sp. DSE1049]|nr:hypothetical protein DL98DRAFT_587234 [Cadophora sp. DSE1049]
MSHPSLSEHRMQPYFAMKANRDPAICHMLHQLGCGFNCESTEDVRLDLQLGCNPTKITYTKRYKARDYLHFARENQVSLLSFDTVSELDDIEKYYPEAKFATANLRFRDFRFGLGGYSHISWSID